MSKFSFKLSGHKAVGLAAGATVFLLAPFGFAGSLAAGAAAAVVGAFASAVNDKRNGVLDEGTLEEVYEVTEHAAVIAVGAVLIGMGTIISPVISFFIKLAAFHYFKVWFYGVLKAYNRTPYITPKFLSISLGNDGTNVRLSF